MLLIIFIFGFAFAYFASQNTASIAVSLATYTIPSVPVYLIILTSFFTGLVLGWVLKMLQSISYHQRLKKMDHELEQKDIEIVSLTKDVHDLEIEKQQLLKKRKNKLVDDLSL